MMNVWTRLAVSVFLCACFLIVLVQSENSDLSDTRHASEGERIERERNVHGNLNNAPVTEVVPGKVVVMQDADFPQMVASGHWFVEVCIACSWA